MQRDNIGLLFCPKPEDYPYRHEQAGDLGVAQSSMSWTPGAVNGKRKRASKHNRTPAEALRSIDEYFRFGGGGGGEWPVRLLGRASGASCR